MEIDEDDDSIVLTPTGKTAAQLRRWAARKTPSYTLTPASHGSFTLTRTTTPTC